MATLSVGEILRGISVATNRDVSADVLNKPEKMDEIMWQLITTYFDMPPTQFIPAFMLKLMNRIVSELQFPQLFSFSDLSESRDRKKWIDFFSCVLCFLQFKSHFKVADEIYKGAIARKDRYSELCNLVSKREDEFTTRQAEIMALQEAIGKVKINCEEATSRYRKLDNEHSGLRQQVSSMQEDLSKRVTNTDRLRQENAELEAECEKSSKNILENVDSLTRFIPMIKAQLDEVEVEMHALFEKRTNLFERTTEFHRYEALLDKLNLDDFYVLLDRYASLKQQVKTLQHQYDEAASELEAKRIEKEDLSRSLSEMQNDMMRQKLLLAKKKKAVQTNSKCGAKDLAALERKTAELQEAVNKSQRTLTLTEEQIKLGHAENDKLDQQLAQADKLAGHLAEIHKKLIALK